MHTNSQLMMSFPYQYAYNIVSFYIDTMRMKTEHQFLKYRLQNRKAS